MKIPYDPEMDRDVLSERQMQEAKEKYGKSQRAWSIIDDITALGAVALTVFFLIVYIAPAIIRYVWVGLHP